jgi:hypothetical protein
MDSLHANPDPRDWAIIEARYKAREALMKSSATPLVGDWLVMDDGEGCRVARVYEDGLQPGPLDGGTYYLDDDGSLKHSGALNPGISLDNVSNTGQARAASAWIFHHDEMRAFNGVTFTIPVRVWMTT